MCIGGVAVIAHGVRRTTADIDVTVRGDAIDAIALVERLRRHDIKPRIPDALEFARDNLVLLLRHEPTGVDLDLSFAWLAFEQGALESRAFVRLGEVSVPVARVEDLVIYKAFAARPQDLRDAEALLLLHGRSIDASRVRRVLRELETLGGIEGRERALADLLRRTVRPRKRGGRRRS